MTPSYLPSAIFPENAITRAEFSYQRRSAKKLRSWRRWLNRTILLLVIFVALIQFGGLLLASLMQRDPTPIVSALGPLPSLLILFVMYYHFYLMFQTISLTANSIARERESKTWELLVLTGVNARQIVRGKWWATVRRQLPRYLLLGLIRAGATAAFAISVATSFYYASNYYNQRLQLPHPLTILITVLFGMLFTVANLAFSAACGVMGSAVSKRSSMAILRGFVIQIVISVIPTAILFFLFVLFHPSTQPSLLRSASQTILLGLGSVVDNGFILLSNPLYVDYQFYSGSGYAPIAPLAFEWMVSALVTVIVYAFFIWFALWRAEKRAVKALATPVGSKIRT